MRLADWLSKFIKFQGSLICYKKLISLGGRRPKWGEPLSFSKQPALRCRLIISGDKTLAGSWLAGNLQILWRSKSVITIWFELGSVSFQRVPTLEMAARNCSLTKTLLSIYKVILCSYVSPFKVNSIIYRGIFLITFITVDSFPSGSQPREIVLTFPGEMLPREDRSDQPPPFGLNGFYSHRSDWLRIEMHQDCLSNLENIFSYLFGNDNCPLIAIKIIFKVWNKFDKTLIHIPQMNCTICTPSAFWHPLPVII